MTLWASVKCRCVKDGLPVPERFQQYFVDEDSPLSEDPRSSEERMQELHALHEWEKTACPHPGMERWSDQVTNWPGLRIFQGVLHRCGIGRFPALLNGIPNHNFTSTEPADAGRMLTEIEALRRLDSLGTRHALVDVGTGENVWEYIPAYAGVETRFEGGDMGVDPRGFFVREVDAVTSRPLVVFCSKAFLQEPGPVPEGVINGLPMATFTDIASGKRYSCPRAVTIVRWPRQPDGTRGEREVRCPRELRLAQQNITAADFHYILEPLEACCRASVETDNPIMWF